MGVADVGDAVAIVVSVKVVGRAIRIKVAGPRELVNAPVVVIVFVVATGASAIGVFVGHAVVVVVHRVLVSEVKVANCSTGPGVDGRGVEVAVGGNVSWIKALSFEGIVVNGALKDTVVVIVPVVHVKDAVVVVVVRVSAVAAVKSLKQVVDTVVVVVQIVEVVDAVVVVVASSGFLEEGRVGRQGRLQHGQVNDDTGRNTRVSPHHVREGLVAEVESGVVCAVPATLSALIGGLDRRHAQAASLDQLGVPSGAFAVVDGLNNRKQAAGQHQKDDDDGHGESLSLFNSLGVLF